MKSADKALGWNETLHDILCGARSPFLLAAYTNKCCEEQKCPFSRTEKAVRKALNPKEDVHIEQTLYEHNQREYPVLFLFISELDYTWGDSL